MYPATSGLIAPVTWLRYEYLIVEGDAYWCSGTVSSRLKHIESLVIPHRERGTVCEQFADISMEV